MSKLNSQNSKLDQMKNFSDEDRKFVFDFIDMFSAIKGKPLKIFFNENSKRHFITYDHKRNEYQIFTDPKDPNFTSWKTPIEHEICHFLFDTKFTTFKRHVEKIINQSNCPTDLKRISNKVIHTIYNVFEDQRIESWFSEYKKGFQKRIIQTRKDLGLNKDIVDKNKLQNPISVLLASRFFRNDLVRKSNFPLCEKYINDSEFLNPKGSILLVKKFYDEIMLPYLIKQKDRDQEKKNKENQKGNPSDQKGNPNDEKQKGKQKSKTENSEEEKDSEKDQSLDELEKGLDEKNDLDNSDLEDSEEEKDSEDNSEEEKDSEDNSEEEKDSEEDSDSDSEEEDSEEDSEEEDSDSNSNSNSEKDSEEDSDSNSEEEDSDSNSNSNSNSEEEDSEEEDSENNSDSNSDSDSNSNSNSDSNSDSNSNSSSNNSEEEKDSEEDSDSDPEKELKDLEDLSDKLNEDSDHKEFEEDPKDRKQNLDFEDLEKQLEKSKLDGLKSFKELKEKLLDIENNPSKKLKEFDDLINRSYTKNDITNDVNNNEYEVNNSLANKLTRVFDIVKGSRKTILDEQGIKINVNQYINSLANSDPNVFKSETKQTGLNIYIIHDMSFSMNNKDEIKGELKTRSEIATNTIATMFKAIRKYPQIKLKVRGFSGIQNAYSDRKKYFSAFDSVRVDSKNQLGKLNNYLGGTMLDLALIDLEKEMKKDHGKKFVIVLTDGMPDSAHEELENYYNYLIKKLFTKKQIGVFGILIGDKLDFMKSVFGKSFAIGNSEEAEKNMVSVFQKTIKENLI